MSTEAMRAAFDAWASTLPLSVQVNVNDSAARGESYTLKAWQAATLEERERAALVCEALTVALDNGGKPYKREATASQCAAAIRSGK